ncbi:hypothetical protein JYB88_03005 [Shewanella cyperi]|uniref:Uncharacterized protein n=1 Tax=Shewanella cyperi TaxID=2814292 RepID=A0A975ALD3_9GAMM|nr:hypothetical protein [Shewanella cyperi]QSX30646.1 hypothetical protein JYB88_03005 [Shewanella cyperi]
MEWETINGITGVISAIGAILGVIQMGGFSSQEVGINLNTRRFFGYVLASCCWALLVLIGHWLFDPFGPVVTREEERQIFAVAISFPVIVGFIYAVNTMQYSPKT